MDELATGGTPSDSHSCGGLLEFLVRKILFPIRVVVISYKESPGFVEGKNFFL